MRRSSTLLAGIVALSAQAAMAASVQIDFSSGGNTSAVPTNSGAAGVWTQKGFDIAWSYVDDFRPGDTVPTNFNSFALVSDCLSGGCNGAGTGMTLSRADGGTFSLESVSANWSYSGWSVLVDHTPVAADGSLDYTASTSLAVPLLRDSLTFSGTKADGPTVAVGGNAVSAALHDPTSGYGMFQGSTLSFNPGDLGKLTDLTSLSIAAPIGVTDFSSEILKALNAFGANSAASAWQACGGISCTIPGLGRYDFQNDAVGVRNDSLATFVEVITVQITPVPVPLPAAAWLLLAGLGLLGLGHRRRSHAA
jgi:hypothetical protein